MGDLAMNTRKLPEAGRDPATPPREDHRAPPPQFHDRAPPLSPDFAALMRRVEAEVYDAA
jgi:hypothetical protein